MATRETTNLILELLDEGILDKDYVIMSCLNYLSEDQVKAMAHANEFFPYDDEEEELEYEAE